MTMMNEKKRIILLLIFILFLFSACSENNNTSQTISLVEIGSEGDLFEMRAYPSLGVFSLSIQPRKSTTSGQPMIPISLSDGDEHFYFKVNPFLSWLYEITLPDSYTQAKIQEMQLRYCTNLLLCKREIQRDTLFLASVTIQKELEVNDSNLFQIVTSDFISMRNANVFVFDSQGQFITPTYVTTNEGYTYTINTFISARNIAFDSSVNGALEYLKSLPEHDHYLEQINPNICLVENATITIIPPHPETVTVSITCNPQTGGVIRIDGGSWITETELSKPVGEEVILQALENDAYSFIGWYEGETMLSNERSCTITVNNPMHIEAVFDPIINQPPHEPENPRPINGSTDIPTTVTLNWDCSDPDGNPLLYEIRFAKFGEPLQTLATQLSQTSYALYDLEEDCEYNWQILADDQQEIGYRAVSESPVWSFKTLESESPDDENTYYCCVNGDDSGDGSIQRPWRTPGFAVRQLNPGDTLIILEGEYIINQFPDDILTIPTGSIQQPIHVKGEGVGKTILKGDDNIYSMIILDNVTNITISDMELTNNNQGWVRDGICGVNLPVEDITLKNLYIHHIDEFGICLKDISKITIDNCTITYCGFGSIGGPYGDSGWQNCTITNCSLSYSGHYYRGLLNNPDLPYDRPDGIGLEPSIGPIIVENCLVEHNRGDGIDLKNKNSFVSKCIVANNYGDGVKLWGDNTVMENCLIYGTGDSNIQSPWCPLVIEQSQEPNASFIIKNCTIHDNPQRPSYSVYSQYNDPTPLKLTIINCTFSDSYGMAYFGENVDLTIWHSNFFAPNRDGQIVYQGVEYNAQELLTCPFGEGIISVDPQFINPVWEEGIGNYKLQSTSQLIDKGTAEQAPNEDLESTQRPQSNGIDIGAYEQ